LVGKREGEIYFALFEEDRAVATVAGTPMTQQVRGRLYKMGGIWGVATHPAARRKGYSKRLLARLLAAVREEGWSLSCLYPFRESFYERMGYVTFPLPRTAKFEPLPLLPLLDQDIGGRVELMLIGDGYDLYRDYVQGMQTQVHGMALFDYGQRALAQRRNNSWLSLAKVGEEVAGLMLYELKGDRATQFTLRASRFYYGSSQGKYLLLQWLARHVDQACEVELSIPAYEVPETWLADLQVRAESAVRAPMGRVVRVDRLGGMQTGQGAFSARVTDPLCRWNEGVWQFETAAGMLQVRPTDLAGCALSIQGLSALIYGTHDPGDFWIRGWGDPAPELQEIMRTMFPAMLPHLHEYF
jgi:predicted acetyltransferase